MEKRILSTWSTLSKGAPIPVWPDGCRDLIVRITNEQEPELLMTTLDETAYMVHMPSGTQFYGVRLMPGTVAVWDQNLRNSEEYPFEKRSFQTCIDSLLKKAVACPEKATELLCEMVTDWFEPATSISEEFLDALHVMQGKIPQIAGSSRTLRRKIHLETGAPPRFWAGLWRVRKAARDIVQSKSRLVDVALAAGYSDQAHLNREIRRWLGITPGDLRRHAASYAHLLRMPCAFTAF